MKPEGQMIMRLGGFLLKLYIRTTASSKNGPWPFYLWCSRTGEWDKAGALLGRWDDETWKEVLLRERRQCLPFPPHEAPASRGIWTHALRRNPRPVILRGDLLEFSGKKTGSNKWPSSEISGVCDNAMLGFCAVLRGWLQVLCAFSCADSAPGRPWSSGLRWAQSAART